MQAGKGYSMRLPRPVQRPKYCSLLMEARVAVTPMGEALTVGVMLASYLGTRVDWRGHGLDADTPPRPATPDRDTALR